MHDFWMHVLLADETEIEPFGHNDHHYTWSKKWEACESENAIPAVKYRRRSVMLWVCFVAGGVFPLQKMHLCCSTTMVTWWLALLLSSKKIPGLNPIRGLSV